MAFAKIQPQVVSTLHALLRVIVHIQVLSFHAVHLPIATTRTLLVYAVQLHSATNQVIQLIVASPEFAITPARLVLQRQAVPLAALAI